MSQHLIVVHLESGSATSGSATSGGTASLRDRDGHNYLIPIAWLPQGAREGSAVLVDISPAKAARSELAIRLAEGITEPEGTDIGA